LPKNEVRHVDAAQGRSALVERRWAFVAVFAVALAVRVLHVWQIRAAPFFSVLMGDSHGYDEWARRIAGGQWVGHEVFYQAPLYPYLLGVIYAVAGRSLLLVRIVQSVMGSVSCVLLALAGARLFSRRVGLAAGVMLAMYAPAIFFDGLLQKSTLDVFFVCLALWLITKTGTAETAERAENNSSFRHARLPSRSSPELMRAKAGGLRLPSFLWLGLAMGGLALTRENAIVLIVVVAVWAAMVSRPKTAAVFLAGVALVLTPVALRNAYVGGGFYVTTSQAGPNFYIGNNPKSDGTYQALRFGRGAPEFERQDATDLAQHALGRTLTPSEVSSYWTERALDFIVTQPASWLTLMVKKTVLLVNAAEMVDTESQETHAEWSMPLRLLGPIGHFGVVVPLAIFGLIATFPSSGASNRSLFWLLYAMTAAYAASVVAFYVFARYRYPLVPFLMLFAAAGLAALPDVFRTRAVPGGIKAVAAIAVAAVVANWPMLSAAWMRAVTEGNLGAALQSDGRLDEAAAHYRRAIALRPDYAAAYSNLGTALRGQGRLDEAVTAYERAITLQPEFPDAHYNLANALVDQGKAAAAIEHFHVALRVVPGSAEVHNNLGIALAANGKAEEAMAEFRAALVADPGSAKAHRNLGDLLAGTERRADAIDHLRRAAELAPGDATIHYDFGSVLLEAGQLDEAIKEFRAALAITPASAETLNNLGIALASQGKLKEAIAEFQLALKLRPGFPDAQKNLVMAMAATQRR
jgi:tetratricopeptide (TPR) repeat protein